MISRGYSTNPDLATIIATITTTLYRKISILSMIKNISGVSEAFIDQKRLHYNSEITRLE